MSLSSLTTSSSSLYGSVPTFSLSLSEDGTFPFLLDEPLLLIGARFLRDNLVESDNEDTEFLCTVASTMAKDNDCTGIGTVKGGGFPSAAPPLAMAVVAKESHEERCVLREDDMAAVHPAADRTALWICLGEWGVARVGGR